MAATHHHHHHRCWLQLLFGLVLSYCSTLAGGKAPPTFDVDVFTAGIGEGSAGCFRIPTILNTNGTLLVFVERRFVNSEDGSPHSTESSGALQTEVARGCRSNLWTQSGPL